MVHYIKNLEKLVYTSCIQLLTYLFLFTWWQKNEILNGIRYTEQIGIIIFFMKTFMFRFFLIGSILLSYQCQSADYFWDLCCIDGHAIFERIVSFPVCSVKSLYVADPLFTEMIPSVALLQLDKTAGQLKHERHLAKYIRSRLSLLGQLDANKLLHLVFLLSPQKPDGTTEEVSKNLTYFE